jgi:hypothetical protein
LATTLAPSELFKRPKRKDIFLTKYKSCEPFELNDGSLMKFIFVQEVYDWILSERLELLRDKILIGEDSKNYRLGDLKKSAEFGGKGKGFGTRIEEREIISVNQQLETIKFELYNEGIIGLPEHLTPVELVKYNWRIEVFLKKFGNEEPFDFVTGPKKKLVYSSQFAKLIKQKDVEKLQGNVLLARNKKVYPIAALKMTTDFLETKGFGVEGKEIRSTNDQLNDIKEKLAAAVVPLGVGTEKYEISLLQKTQGQPKSDFHFIDQMGKERVWISHKDGKKVTDFQQWSGITEPGIIEHKEIKDFIDAVKAMFPLGIENGVTVARHIHDKRLQKKAVYGVNYGGPFGKQNVTLIVQGPIDITKNGNFYRVCSNHVHLNGDDIIGDFTPILMATYKGDRAQFGVKGARFTIQPEASRKISEWI